MPDLKILYIITQADGGGAQKYVLSLAGHFKGRVASGDESQDLFDAANGLQLTTYSLKHLKRNISPFHDLMAVFEIRQLVKTLKPDIVHLNSSKAGVLGSFACIGLSSKGGSLPAGRAGASGGKIKVIYTAHGFVFNEPLPFWLKNLYLALETIASKYRSFIIAVSGADKKSALQNKLINENKISVVYNGIEPINFLPKDQAKNVLNIPKNKFLFGTIANFYKTKGLDILVDAVNLLPSEIKEKCQFVIIGNGPTPPPLPPFVRGGLRGGENMPILLLDKVENAFRYLKAFNAFILPSRKEGFSYTILEAMQAGLPIIATDVGGNKEALGEAGILCKPNNPASLARAIEQIFYDNSLQNNLSQKAFLQSQKFTKSRMLAETEKIYREVLSKNLF